jgi:hypothetical protein
MIVLICYGLSALSLVWPIYQYQSSNNDSRLQDIAAFAVTVVLSALWPFWLFMLLRKAFLTRLLGASQ